MAGNSDQQLGLIVPHGECQHVEYGGLRCDGSGLVRVVHLQVFLLEFQHVVQIQQD